MQSSQSNQSKQSLLQFFTPIIHHLDLQTILNLRLCCHSLKNLVYKYAFTFKPIILKIKSIKQGKIIKSIIKSVNFKANITSTAYAKILY